MTRSVIDLCPFAEFRSGHRLYINIRPITCTGHQIYRQSTNTVCHQLFRFISLAWFWFKNWDFYIKIIMQMKHIWDAMGGYIPVFRHLYPQGNMGGWLTITLLCLSGYQFCMPLFLMRELSLLDFVMCYICYGKLVLRRRQLSKVLCIHMIVPSLSVWL